VTTIEITIPDALAAEASGAGLLAPEAIERLLRDKLAADRIARLQAVRAALAANPQVALTRQEINDEIANQIIGVMLYLDSEDNTKPISLYINSPGGSVTSGFAMFDTMRHIKSEVSTINVGLAASMGSFLLMGGTKGKRLALPHSRTMIHQPSGGAQGQASDIKVEAEQILSIRERVVNYYSQLSGQPREKVRMDIDRDNFMSAEETLKYGLIDRVIQRT
jgi:ATP-dependent Clp endopeptidase proteolytic subunit ClpP